MDPRERQGKKGRLAGWFSRLGQPRPGNEASPRPPQRTPAPNPADKGTLSDLLRRSRVEILGEWEQAVRQLPAGRDLPRPLLIDHIPHMLEEIAQMADALREGREPEPPAETAEIHAHERLTVGFDLSAVVAEYAALRSTITRLLWTRERLPDGPDALLILNQAIDTAVVASVDRYTHARDRTLGAIDQIATASLQAKNLPELLEALLEVFLETTASVDCAAILLREGDMLQVRAAVGLEEEVSSQFTVKIGEGFSGTIAAERRPLFLPSASDAPLVLSPVLRFKGVQALYGVPLVDNGEVIGVAHMGSRRSHELSDQDRHLFAALASRTTAAIVQYLLRESLEKEHIELREALQAREQILGIVSHDLRNPLSVITMGLELLGRKAPPGEAGVEMRQRTDTILRHARHMARIIGDLVDLAALEAKRLSVARKPEDPRQLVREAVAGYEGHAHEKKLVLQSEIEGEPRRVLCDHDRVLQIFGNLVGNAISATEPGGSVVVRVAPREGEVVFSVSDTGRGIPKGHLPNLFKPYWRGDETAYKGTGLGLAISQGLVTAQGGKLWVESELGRGTTFFFTLPVDKTEG